MPDTGFHCPPAKRARLAACYRHTKARQATHRIIKSMYMYQVLQSSVAGGCERGNLSACLVLCLPVNGARALAGQWRGGCHGAHGSPLRRPAPVPERRRRAPQHGRRLSAVCLFLCAAALWARVWPWRPCCVQQPCGPGGGAPLTSSTLVPKRVEQRCMWACGHAGMRACGHVGMRACGHVRVLNSQYL